MLWHFRKTPSVWPHYWTQALSSSFWTHSGGQGGRVSKSELPWPPSNLLSSCLTCLLTKVNLSICNTGSNTNLQLVPPCKVNGSDSAPQPDRPLWAAILEQCLLLGTAMVLMLSGKALQLCWQSHFICIYSTIFLLSYTFIYKFLSLPTIILHIAICCPLARFF